MNKKQLLFIVNPFSGISDNKQFEKYVISNLNLDKYDYSISFTTHQGHAIELSRSAVEQNIYMIIAVGGDGTVNEVASSMVYSKTILGIIPTGSGNGFSSHFKISRNISKSIKVLNDGQVQLIDTCLCNNRFFINIAGVGFDGYISNIISGKSKRGIFLYMFKMLSAFFSYKSSKYAITIDDKALDTDTYYCVAIANASTYGYQFQIAPQAKLTDGLFDVVLIHNVSLWKQILSLGHYFKGKVTEIDHVDIIHGKSIKVSSNNELVYHVDGEGGVFKHEIQFDIVPKSIHIMVPE